MRRCESAKILLLTAVLTAAGAALVHAAELEGTVTLRGGKTLTGEIKVAQVGVLQGCGIGTLLPDLGFFRLKVGDKVVEVKAAELAQAEIEWGLIAENDPQSWEIKQITIVKRDGMTITGKPTWSVQATSVVVGTEPALYAFPKAGLDFAPENLLAKIEIAGAMPAVVTPPETPAAVITPPTPPETPTAPPETPATPPALPETPTETPPTPAPPTVVTAEVTPAIGQGAMEVVVTCPHCGEKMVIRVVVNVTPLGE